MLKFLKNSNVNVIYNFFRSIPIETFISSVVIKTDINNVKLTYALTDVSIFLARYRYFLTLLKKKKCQILIGVETDR